MTEPVTVSTIIANNEEKFYRMVDLASSLGVDAVELRVDALDKNERGSVPDMIQLSKLPVITTLRRTADGGTFEDKDEELRVRLATKAMDQGSQFIDIEADAPQKSRGTLFNAAAANGTKVILSLHRGYMPSIDEMGYTYTWVSRLPHDIMKMVFIPHTRQDALTLLDAALSLRAHGNPYTLFGMGKFGVQTRLLSLLTGSAITYCSLEDSSVAANLYQIRAPDMVEMLGAVRDQAGWPMIRKNPKWVMSLAKAWANLPEEEYFSVNGMKRRINDGLKQLLEDIKGI